MTRRIGTPIRIANCRALFQACRSLDGKILRFEPASRQPQDTPHLLMLISAAMVGRRFTIGTCAARNNIFRPARPPSRQSAAPQAWRISRLLLYRYTLDLSTAARNSPHHIFRAYAAAAYFSMVFIVASRPSRRARLIAHAAEERTRTSPSPRTSFEEGARKPFMLCRDARLGRKTATSHRSRAAAAQSDQALPESDEAEPALIRQRETSRCRSSSPEVQRRAMSFRSRAMGRAHALAISPPPSLALM